MFNYTIEKYGLDHCAAVSTFAIRKAKTAIRAVCKLLEIDLETEDKIAKLIPTVYYLDDDSGEDKLVDLTIQEALDHVPELQEYQTIYPELFDIAQQLEGLECHTSIHSAGTLSLWQNIWKSDIAIKVRGKTTRLVSTMRIRYRRDPSACFPKKPMLAFLI